MLSYPEFIALACSFPDLSANLPQNLKCTSFSFSEGRVQPEVEGGVGAKNIMKNKCTEGARKILGLQSKGILWFFTE